MIITIELMVKISKVNISNEKDIFFQSIYVAKYSNKILFYFYSQKKGVKKITLVSRNLKTPVLRGQPATLLTILIQPTMLIQMVTIHYFFFQLHVVTQIVECIERV